MCLSNVCASTSCFLDEVALYLSHNINEGEGLSVQHFHLAASFQSNLGFGFGCLFCVLLVLWGVLFVF